MQMEFSKGGCRVKTFEVGSFQVNCSIVSFKGRHFVVDPGGDPSKILEELSSAGISSFDVLLTHAHFDHIGAIGELERVNPALKVYVTKEDLEVFVHPFNAYPPEYVPQGRPSCPADPAELSREGIEAIFTPGHTPGGVSYYFKDAGIVFTGDTLFRCSVGRTDLPGGDMRVLRRSLSLLTALPDDTAVIPGHGPETTIGSERKDNPYL